MRNRAERTEEKQAGTVAALGQLLLPMIAGIARSRQALLEWVHQVGLVALAEVFERFGHLQQRFGRWGLTWLESLLRCADIAASKQREQASEPGQRESAAS